MERKHSPAPYRSPRLSGGSVRLLGRIRPGPRVWGLLVVAALAPALAACPSEEGGGFRSLSAGDPAPAYAAPTLEGDTLSLAELRGQAVLLNVWATWCLPCRQEMPDLQALHEELGDEGLRVIGVSIDSRGAGRDVRDFLQQYGISFTILHDPEERVTRTFRMSGGIPQTFLIDREGRIVQRWIGIFNPDTPENRARLTEALGGAGGRV